jgi:cell division septum initiation protein DivIVA
MKLAKTRRLEREAPMTDSQIKDRVKVVLAGMSADTKTSEHPLVMPGAIPPNQALQVLTLAQRTAEEHVAIAHKHADKIRTDAQAAADQVAREAQAHADRVRAEADKVLTDAQAAADKSARDARARVEEAQRDADRIVSKARAQAETIAEDARGHAEKLKLQAQQRYEDSVGSLRAKREALQQQIETLEQFDHDYRTRLSHFLQNQMRALWVNEPALDPALIEDDEAETDH